MGTRLAKFVVHKILSVRLRYITGDPSLKDKALDQVHSDREFDRIYLLGDPFFWYKIATSWGAKKDAEFKLPGLGP